MKQTTLQKYCTVTVPDNRQVSLSKDPTRVVKH